MCAKPNEKLCECGCGQAVANERRSYRQGHWNRGRSKSAEHRRKISESNKGKATSEETRAKLSRARTGSKMDEAQRLKMVGRPSPGTRGPLNPSWKGGRHIRRGYRLVWVGLGHPHGGRRGYAWEHRLVMAEHVGRKLTRREVVHHINLDKLDNAIENLVVVTNSQHSSIHRYIEHRGMDPREAVRFVLGAAA